MTLGVTDFARSVRFYQDLGFERRMKATGDEIAFFDAGGMILSLFRWDDAGRGRAAFRPSRGRRRFAASRWRRCAAPTRRRRADVEALAAGATLLKHAQKTAFGGYSGYFADPDGHAWEAVRAPGFEFTADGRVSCRIDPEG